MLEVVVFYNGPRTQWSGKVVDDDVIARIPAPFMWIARMQARGLCKSLNQERCGYLILRGEAVLEERIPS